MGTFYNPKIVTDGLIGCYDPGSKLSYSGSGSALNDLTKNYDATLVGSPPFNQTLSAADLILRNKSDYGGQVGGLPDGSWDIHSSFIALYFSVKLFFIYFLIGLHPFNIFFNLKFLLGYGFF